jgi:hypothetical protein
LNPLSVTDDELDRLADRAKRAARVQPAARTDLAHFSPDVAAFFDGGAGAIDVARKARVANPRPSPV